MSCSMKHPPQIGNTQFSGGIYMTEPTLKSQITGTMNTGHLSRVLFITNKRSKLIVGIFIGMPNAAYM